MINEIMFQFVLQVSSPRPSHTSGLDSMFRPFNMHGMDNVSILFADIVGFTRMSSNKVQYSSPLFLFLVKSMARHKQPL